MTNILLVEDNPIDARLLQRVFRDIKDWPTRITWVDDGEKALRYVRYLEEPTEGVRLPDLMLLDVNLPKYDGFQVLEAIRKTASLQDIPVFMMSSASVESIVNMAEVQRLTADGFFDKGCGLEGFEKIVSSLRQWNGPPRPLFQVQGVGLNW